MAATQDTVAAAAKAATREKVARLAFWSILVACVVLVLKLGNVFWVEDPSLAHALR